MEGFLSTLLLQEETTFSHKSALELNVDDASETIMIISAVYALEESEWVCVLPGVILLDGG